MGLSTISRKERGERKGVQKDFQCPLLALDRLLGGGNIGELGIKSGNHELRQTFQ